jgi:uncharacterized alkaline shock family protein YloU
VTTPLENLGEVADVHVASAAAGAARATPGVERLQPGLWGLVQQLSHELWERATGEAYPDVAGVEVEMQDGVALVDVTLATDGTIPAGQVAAAVQRAVVDAVAARTAVPVLSVAVHVCEIALPR